MRGNRFTTENAAMSFQELLIGLVKAHSFKAGCALMLSWLTFHILPVAHFLAAGAFLVATDWVTGVAASIKARRKITSRGLIRTIGKITWYSLAIVLTLIVEKVYLHTTFMVITVSLYISFVELFSNLENISALTDRDIIGIVRRAVFARLPWIKSLLTDE